MLLQSLPPPLLTRTVFLFTSMLFYSGYFLQQRTVRDIQAALHPPIPSVTPSPSATPATRDSIGARTSTTDSSPYGGPQAVLTTSPPTDWSRNAYAHIVRHPRDACAAAMLFASLARSHSPAQRLLLYPESWDQAPDPNAAPTRASRQLSTAMRLLRAARDRYDAKLRAVPPLIDLGDDAAQEDSASLQRAYPVAGLLSLTNYKRVLHMRAPGLLRDAGALDAVFDVPANASVVRLSGGTAADAREGEDARKDESLLLRPSKEAYRQVAAASVPMERLAASVDLRAEAGTVIAGTTALRGEVLDQEPRSVGAQFLDEVAYMEFDDPGVAGPEFDIPDGLLARARPEGEAGRIWNGLYEKYRGLRMDVCGLDLEPLAATSM